MLFHHAWEVSICFKRRWLEGTYLQWEASPPEVLDWLCQALPYHCRYNICRYISMYLRTEGSLATDDLCWENLILVIDLGVQTLQSFQRNPVPVSQVTHSVSVVDCLSERDV
jgi:hypothetical protein